MEVTRIVQQIILNFPVSPLAFNSVNVIRKIEMVGKIANDFIVTYYLSPGAFRQRLGLGSGGIGALKNV